MAAVNKKTHLSLSFFIKALIHPWGTHKDESNIYPETRNVKIAKSQKKSVTFSAYMRAVQAAIYMPRHAKVLEIQASLYRKTKSPFEPNICIQLFQESLSKKCTRKFPKGIVGGFEFNVIQRNLKEWHKRPWKCLRLLKEATKEGSTDYTARNRVLIISNITFQDCRVHIFSDMLSIAVNKGV